MTDTMLQNFIAESVKKLADTDSNSTYYMQLDNDLAIYVGWSSGFDPDDKYIIHSKSDPDCGICVKLAKWNPADIDYEWMDMPWDSKTEEVDDNETSVGPTTNYRKLANWFLKKYESVKVDLDCGKLTI